MASGGIWPRCIAFYYGINSDAIKIRSSNAVNLCQITQRHLFCNRTFVVSKGSNTFDQQRTGSAFFFDFSLSYPLLKYTLSYSNILCTRTVYLELEYECVIILTPCVVGSILLDLYPDILKNQQSPSLIYRYDYLEFTDSKERKRRFDSRVGTSDWPQVIDFISRVTVKTAFYNEFPGLSLSIFETV